MTHSPTPPSPVPLSLTAKVVDGVPYLSCRMTDGSEVFVGGVTGYIEGNFANFSFNPSPLPDDVNSPDEIDFHFIDVDSQVPHVEIGYSVRNFVVEGGAAFYSIVITAGGVDLSEPQELSTGEESPYMIQI